MPRPRFFEAREKLIKFQAKGPRKSASTQQRQRRSHKRRDQRGIKGCLGFVDVCVTSSVRVKQRGGVSVLSTNGSSFNHVISQKKKSLYREGS